MKRKAGRAMSLVLCCALLAGCGQSSLVVTDAVRPAEAEVIEAAPAADNTEMFTQRDSRSSYDESEAVTISLQGSAATADSSAVKISGSTVTLSDEGC